MINISNTHLIHNQLHRSKKMKVEAQDNILNFPEELLMKIFSYLSNNRKTMRVINKKIKALIDDEHMVHCHAKIRLNDLKDTFNKLEGFSDRWTVQMTFVESRLKVAEEDITSKNIYKELVKFQAKRFPRESFKDDNDPLTVEGYLERENIIKKWNTYLFYQKVFSDKELKKPGNKKSLESVLEQVNGFDSFDGCALNLARTGLTEIPEEVNKYGDFLSYLSLNGNEIFYIPKNSFSSLARLENLRLYDNQIAVIEQGAFSGLTSLEWGLFLSQNQIAVIERGVFSDLTRLQNLSLSHNRITVIEQGAFSRLASLRNLFLSHNRITAIEQEAFSGLTSLRKLWLGNNRISVIEQGAFSGLTSLEWGLWLNHNQIAVIEQGAFSGLTKLQKFSLSHNRIIAIEQGAFSGLASLRELWLDKELIELIDDNENFKEKIKVV